MSLDSVVEAALETVQPVLDARHQTVSVRQPGEKIFVDGDGVRLCQVVANLLTNASKYSPERARIEIVIESSADGWRGHRVRDPGVGIDAQLLPHLFELFLQGDRTLDRTEGGSGVGLTIVKLLVDMHGGTRRGEQRGLGKGSEFRIRLPRVDAGFARLAAAMRRKTGPPCGRAACSSSKTMPMPRIPCARCCARTGTKSKWSTTARRASRSSKIFAPTSCCSTSGCRAWMATWSRTRSANVSRSRAAGRGCSRSRVTDAMRTGDTALKAGFDGHLAKPVDPRRLLHIVADEMPATASRGRPS